jgi:hypothetical protein
MQAFAAYAQELYSVIGETLQKSAPADLSKTAIHPRRVSLK